MRAYFHLPYRQTQGVVIAHANKIPNTPNYSTISRRINRMEIKINEKLGNDIVIALDSTGIKVTILPNKITHSSLLLLFIMYLA